MSHRQGNQHLMWNSYLASFKVTWGSLKSRLGAVYPVSIS